MTQRNQQIEGVLTYYYKLPQAPQYAVLLKGKWGSGKTWFIRKSIEQLEDSGGKALYISLYGVSSTRQIDQEFFRQLHPVLGSKGAALVGRVFKGLVKATVKVDLDGDGKEDDSLSFSLPDIDLAEYMRATEGFVLVFDDVERCPIPIGELLGYINYFVEHGGHKTVLVANEDEILAKNGDTSQTGNEYRRIKEKLIGKTFEIEPDLNNAVYAFVEELETPGTKKILQQNLGLIQELYIASEYQNLRHLRQAILDYARLLATLEDEVLKQDELLTHLLTMFLIYSFEIKSGHIQPNDITQIESSFYSSSVLKGNNRESLYNLLSRKYVGINLLDTLLPSQLWQDILSSGILEPQRINEAIKISKYFASQTQPDWVRLWHAFSLTDNEFDSLLETVSERFQNNEYDNANVLRHVVGILLMLTGYGLYSKSKDEILAIAFKNVDDLKAKGTLRQQFTNKASYSADIGFAGLMFHDNETPEFKIFDEYLKTRGREAVKEGYPGEAKDLLALMLSDTQKFCRLLVANQLENRYYNVPILQYIDPDTFVKTTERLSPDQLKLINGAIKERYSSDQFNKELKPEQTWLEDVANKLTLVKAGRAGKITGFLLGLLGESFAEAAKLLKAAASTH